MMTERVDCVHNTTCIQYIHTTRAYFCIVNDKYKDQGAFVRFSNFLFSYRGRSYYNNDDYNNNNDNK